MSFRFLFRSLPFLALVFAAISLVCFGVQEKKVGKNSCFGVPVFRCSAVSWFSNARKLLPKWHVLILHSTVFYGCSLASVLSVGIQLESAITKKEYGNFYWPHEFDLNNISSSFLVLQLYFKALSRLHIKISSLRRFDPDLQGHLATIHASMVSK